MKKKDFIKLLENIDDETNIVVPSKTQFRCRKKLKLFI